MLVDPLVLRPGIHIAEAALEGAVAQRNTPAKAIGERANFRHRRRCVVQRKPREGKLARAGRSPRSRLRSMSPQHS